VPRIEADLSRVEWRTKILGARGNVTVDIADVIPLLWRATGVALWQLDVQKGAGERDTDIATAYLAGALPRDAETLRLSLEPYGVRTRTVDFAQFAKRLGVGLERAEVRVRVRDGSRAAEAPS
jgi:hypothetical protein